MAKAYITTACELKFILQKTIFNEFMMSTILSLRSGTFTLKQPVGFLDRFLYLVRYKDYMLLVKGKGC